MFSGFVSYADSAEEIENSIQAKETEAGALCLGGQCDQPSPIPNQSVCEALVNSELCQSVPEEERKSCGKEGDAISGRTGQSIWGCLDYTVGEMIRFIWSALKWAGSNIVSSEARKKTGEATDKALASAKLYLNTEYEKAYQASAPSSIPGKRASTAVMKTAGAVGKLLYDLAVDTVSSDIEEWECFNAKARGGKICRYLAGLIGAGYTGAKLFQMLSRRSIRKTLNSPNKARRQNGYRNIKLLPEKERSEYMRQALADGAIIPVQQNIKYLPLSERFEFASKVAKSDIDYLVRQNNVDNIKHLPVFSSERLEFLKIVSEDTVVANRRYVASFLNKSDDILQKNHKVQYVKHFMKDKDPKVRAQIGEYISANLAGEGTRNLRKTALDLMEDIIANDPDPFVRKSIFNNMSRFNTNIITNKAQWRSLLLKMSGDPDAGVRRAVLDFSNAFDEAFQIQIIRNITKAEGGKIIE